MSDNDEQDDLMSADDLKFFLNDLTKDEKLRFICLKIALDYKMSHNAVSSAYHLYAFITNTMKNYTEK